MWDYKTGTYWDHITGEAVHGPLKGCRLDIWPVEITTVEAAIAEYEQVEFYRSDSFSWRKIFMGKFFGRGLVQRKGIVPPHFRRTMQRVDDRLPEMTQGLGIFSGQQAVFYPMDQIPPAGIQDIWQGRRICIRKGEIDRVPYAVYEDNPSSRPMQLLTRWYGFSLTFSDSRVYGQH